MARAIPGDCPECGGADLRFRVVESGGFGGPNLLPGLGGLQYSPLTVVVCRACGLVRMFAHPQALAKLDHARDWQSVAAVEAAANERLGAGREG